MAILQNKVARVAQTMAPKWIQRMSLTKRFVCHNKQNKDDGWTYLFLSPKPLGYHQISSQSYEWGSYDKVKLGFITKISTLLGSIFV
jgi:hypothetical protein